MKLKMRFDKESLQAFFLGNVEKIVFGVIVIGCGVLIFLPGRKTFQAPLPSPKTLQDLTAQADGNVKNTDPRECSLYKECKVTEYQEIAGRSEDKLAEKDYPLPNLWNPPVFEAKVLRDAPAVFAVQNLRAVFGRGALLRAGAGGAAGGGERGYRWIVVTGAVPFKKQVEAYEAVFKEAISYDPRADFPKYVGYVVERAEVASGQEPEWKEIDLDAAEKRARYLGNPQKDWLDDKYLDSTITVPLLPLTGKPWGSETLHVDIVGPSFDAVQKDTASFKDRKVVWQGDTRIISQTPEQREERPLVAFTARLADPGKKPEERLFAVLFASVKDLQDFGKSGAIRGKVAGRETIKLSVPGRTDPESVDVPLLVFEAPERKTLADEGDEVEVRVPGRPPRAVPPGGGHVPVTGAGHGETVDYKLFRFFDLNIEPGKHYQYRVRLVLKNPNHLAEEPKVKPKPGGGRESEPPRREQLQARFLKNPARDGTSPTLTTAATPPTEPVTVPEDLRLLALSVAPPARPYTKNDTAGMSGKMAVVQWVPTTGREARHEFDAQRGTLANFPGVTPAAKTGERERPAKTDFITESVVLDMHVAPIDKDTNGTGEIIVVDGQGRLRVLSQLEGEVEYALLQQAAANAGTPPPGGHEGEGETQPPPDEPGGPVRAKRPGGLQEEGPPSKRGLDFEPPP